MTDSLPADYFNRIYDEAVDPWSFASSPYEAAKYAATIAALPRDRYESAFEIGCSVGVLTTALAQRCNALLAVDAAPRALAQARVRCQQQPWVELRVMQVPDRFPSTMFDLVVVSEVAYYWSQVDFDRAAILIGDHLVPGGHLILVHWTPFVADYPLTGDFVHERYLAQSAASVWPFVHRAGCREEQYRLDVFERTV